MAFLDETGLTYFWGKVKGWVNNSQHPVGSIYISTSASFNPQEAWGGTWKKTADGRCLIGANATYPLGSTGGEAEHKLLDTEMPEHDHKGNALVIGPDSWGWGNVTLDKYSLAFNANENYYTSQKTVKANHCSLNAKTGTAGSGKAHNNMQPYLAVYIWERTA